MNNKELINIIKQYPIGSEGLVCHWEGVSCTLEGIDYPNESIILERVNVKPIEVKVLLRPLSQLNKLDVEFETEHSINIMLSENTDLEYGAFSCYKNEITFEIESDSDLRYDTTKSFSFKDLEKVRNILLNNFYDVFGLIEKGYGISTEDERLKGLKIY